MSTPSVFEADLPVVQYKDATTPDEAHRNLRKAREQGPIAMGAHGPEILSYELVRETLRDARFQVPRGLGLETQGITSGPLWRREAHGRNQRPGNPSHRLHRGLITIPRPPFSPKPTLGRKSARRSRHFVDLGG